MPRYDFDMFTIGAGSGGVASSRRAGSYGARVAICEESRVGGTCVIRGCVPKKLLVYGAQFADAFADAAGFGWTVPVPSFDWPALIDAKDREIERLSQIYRNMLKNSGVELIEGRGVLVDPHTDRDRRPGLHRRQDPDRRRLAPDGAGHPRHRACDLVQRGARSAGPAAPHRHRRRRLYRGRVRRDLQRLRRRGRRADPPRGAALRLRRRHPHRAGAGDARPRRRDPRPHPGRADREAGPWLLGLHDDRPGIFGRCRDVCDRAKAEHEGARSRRDRRRDHRQRRRRRRRMVVQQCSEHLCGRRRDRPDQSDAGRDRRRPRRRRDPVQRQPDQDGPRQCALGGVQPAADRRGRPDRSSRRAGNTARSTSTAPASSR